MADPGAIGAVVDHDGAVLVIVTGYAAPPFPINQFVLRQLAANRRMQLSSDRSG